VKIFLIGTTPSNYSASIIIREPLNVENKNILRELEGTQYTEKIELRNIMSIRNLQREMEKLQ
jgi:hypothetical protein